MIIAVIAVTMMEFIIAEVIKMIAMGHQFMAFSLVVTRAGNRGTGRGIRTADRDHMFIIVVAMEKMQVALV